MEKESFMTAAKIESEIYDYVHGFNLEQKKAALNAVKEIAEEKDDSGYSEEFKRELDSRYEDILAGRNMVTEEEARQRIQAIIKGGKKK